MNKNVEWINSTGAWAFYIALIFVGWAVTCLFVDPGAACTMCFVALPCSTTTVAVLLGTLSLLLDYRNGMDICPPGARRGLIPPAALVQGVAD